MKITNISKPRNENINKYLYRAIFVVKDLVFFVHFQHLSFVCWTLMINLNQILECSHEICFICLLLRKIRRF